MDFRIADRQELHKVIPACYTYNKADSRSVPAFVIRAAD